MLEAEIQALVDERKIYNVLARYCMGADRRDASMMLDCYWPEATDDHGIAPPLGAKEFVTMAVTSDIMKSLSHTQHVLGQVSYAIKGARAQVESYVISYHKVMNKPDCIELLFGNTYKNAHKYTECDGHDLMVGGRYLDLFEKRGEEWRILKRVATAEWGFAEPASQVMREGLFKTGHGPGSAFPE